MILLEFIFGIIKKVLRFFVWLITARDCEHCKYGTFTKWGWWCNINEFEKKKTCKTTVMRCYFKRRGKGGAE